MTIHANGMKLQSKKENTNQGLLLKSIVRTFTCLFMEPQTLTEKPTDRQPKEVDFI